MLLTTARGGRFSRAARGALGLSLLTRGATGYCHVKAALTDRGVEALADLTSNATSRQPRVDVRGGVAGTAQRRGRSCAELANDLARTMSHPELAFRLQEYATELQARRTDLESLLARIDADLPGEADDAMRALIDETEKMWRVCAANVRDAAVTASVQRIMHYKIAGYGAIAAYAKALGREAEAAHFAQLADRDKAVDAELSELAKGTLNPEAAVAPKGEQRRKKSPQRPH